MAGLFYPADPARARAEVEALLTAADSRGGGSVDHRDVPRRGSAPKALIVPHAGWRYSGDLAALGWRTLVPLRGTVSRVVLLGPTHRVAVRGLALPDADHVDSPLGPLRVPVDEVLSRTAHLPTPVRVHAATHRDEHALEVHFPFIHRVLGQVQVIPLNVGVADPADVADVIEELWGGNESVIAVSSDLSHHLSDRQAQVVDAETITRVLDRQDVESGRACGASPLNGLLEVCRRRDLHPRLLGAHNSSTVNGDVGRVVGYATFAVQEKARP
ncbi:AmmeMemoRadiSam system protein B [Schaalia sp. 19OD2882]|nr:AmmeMemoRadiSam system protein B [Schaalia sp. 19OD2882]